MFNMFKKWFCKHEFKSLETYKMDTDPSVGYKEEQMHVVYCPKCKKQQTVTWLQYNILMAKQKVDEEYRNEQSKQN